MESVMEFASTINVTEFVRAAWMEVALASFAVTCYLTLSSGLAEYKKSKSSIKNLKVFGTHLANNPRQGKSKKDSFKKDLVLAIRDIRLLGNDGNFDGAVKAFEKQRAIAPSEGVYNCMIDVCIGCGEHQKAMEYFKEAKDVGLIDVISYNTAMKGCLSQGDIDGAQSLFAEISEKGFSPSHASYHCFLNFFITSGESDRAWRIVQDMQLAGVAPTGLTCSLLLKGRLSSKAEMDRILALVDTVHPFDAQLFQHVAEACIRAGHSHLIDVYWAKLASQGVSRALSVASYGSMIKAYGQAHDVKHMWYVWEDMIKNQVLPSNITLGCMVESLVSNSCTEDAVKLVHDMRKSKITRPLVDVVVYASIMKGLAYERKASQVMSMYDSMMSDGITGSVIMYNIIFNALAEKGAMNRVPALLGDMKQSGEEPNAITYCTIAKGYCNSGSVDRALDLLKYLKAERKTDIDEIFYNTILEGCLKDQRHDEALALFEDMKKAGLTPSNCTMTTMVKLLSQCGRLNEAFALIQNIRNEYGVEISIQTYTCLIQAHGHAYNVDQVWRLLGQIEADGVELNCITLGCVVDALVKNGCTEDAWKFVRGKASEPTTRPLVNVVVYNTILKGLVHVEDAHKVIAVYEEMKAEGISPDIFTYNTILNAYAQHHEGIQRVPALLEDMRTAVPLVEPDLVTYSTIIKGYCKAGSTDRAFDVLKQMEARGKIVPDQIIYNILFNQCTVEHRIDDARELFAGMRSKGIVPSNYTLSMLVKIMSRCKRVDEAFSLVEDSSREFGIKVNIQVYTCLIQACFFNRQPSKAVALHDQIIKEGLVPDEKTYTALVSGCLRAGLVQQAVHLTKCAHGLATPKVKGTPPGIASSCIDELVFAMGLRSEDAKAFLAELACCQVGSSTGNSKGKGKGKGAFKTGDAMSQWHRRS